MRKIMERFDEETIRRAYALHQELIMKGKISRKRNPDLYNAFYETSVRSLMYNVFLPESKAEILSQDDVLYFVPEMDNDLFAYTNDELRKKMKLTNNKQLYLAQFIFINVLGEFYGEQYHLINEPRSFVKLEQIVAKVRTYIDKFKKMDQDTQYEVSNEYDLNLIGMIEAWEDLNEETDDIKNIRRAPKRLRGFFLDILHFWVNEKLLVIQDDEEISLTEKMKGIAGNYFNHSDRITKIKELLQEENEKGEVKYA